MIIESFFEGRVLFRTPVRVIKMCYYVALGDIEFQHSLLTEAMKISISVKSPCGFFFKKRKHLPIHLSSVTNSRIKCLLLKGNLGEKMLRCYLISFRLTFPTEKTAGDNFGLKNNFEVANFIKIEFKWHLSKRK